MFRELQFGIDLSVTLYVKKLYYKNKDNYKKFTYTDTKN